MLDQMISIRTLEGTTLLLNPVRLGKQPSLTSATEYLQFIDKYCDQHTLHDREHKRLRLFMLAHETEAVTDGANYYSLAGSKLIFCKPENFIESKPVLQRTVVFCGRTLRPHQTIINSALVTVQSCDDQEANVSVTLDAEVFYARFTFSDCSFALSDRKPNKYAKQFFEENYLMIHAFCHLVDLTSSRLSKGLLGAA